MKSLLKLFLPLLLTVVMMHAGNLSAAPNQPTQRSRPNPAVKGQLPAASQQADRGSTQVNETLQQQFNTTQSGTTKFSFRVMAPGLVTIDISWKGGPVTVVVGNETTGKTLFPNSGNPTAQAPSSRIVYTITATDLQQGYLWYVNLASVAPASGTMQVIYPRPDKARLDASISGAIQQKNREVQNQVQKRQATPSSSSDTSLSARTTPQVAASSTVGRIGTSEEQSHVITPPGPCSGVAHIIVGPRLGRTETTATTIAWALDRAAGRNLCGVEIEVQPGIYGDSLTITRDTTITNSPPLDRPVLTGSITSNKHYLTMTGIIMRDTPAPGAIVLTGGRQLTVSLAGFTVLQNVTIERASERGIAMSGGVLKITSSEIRGTKASASRQGVGIDLSSVQLATLDSVALQDNVGWGIVATGSGTVLKAKNVSVRGTTMLSRMGDPLPASRASVLYATGDVGAIRVAGGASLYGDTLFLEQNEFVGLLVDQGGQANVQNSTFSGTGLIGGDNGGGNNITARAGCTLELLNFTSSRGARAGLSVNGGWVKGKDGVLSYNEFGLDIISSADGWRRQNCFENTRSFENRSQDLAGDLDVPLSSSTSDNQPQGCRGVPVPPHLF